MIKYSAGVLETDGNVWDLDYPVSDAFEFDSNIIILFDSDFALKIPQFHSLTCFSQSKKLIWSAKLPTFKPADTYTELLSKSPLIVRSFCCYEVEIAPKTGKIINKIFTK